MPIPNLLDIHDLPTTADAPEKKKLNQTFNHNIKYQK